MRTDVNVRKVLFWRYRKVWKNDISLKENRLVADLEICKEFC